MKVVYLCPPLVHAGSMKQLEGFRVPLPQSAGVNAGPLLVSAFLLVLDRFSRQRILGGMPQIAEADKLLRVRQHQAPAGRQCPYAYLSHG